MKNKLNTLIILFAIILTYNFTISDKYFKDKNENKKVTSEYKYGKRRYRCEDRNANYFKLDKNLIRIEIPVTHKSLRIRKKPVNISSPTINAILILIKGDKKHTSCDGIVKTLNKEYRISRIKTLDKERLKQDKKLIVVVFNNDKLSKQDIQDFKDLIKASTSYQKAIDRLNLLNNCDEKPLLPIFRPRESGGDIINAT